MSKIFEPFLWDDTNATYALKCMFHQHCYVPGNIGIVIHLNGWFCYCMHEEVMVCICMWSLIIFTYLGSFQTCESSKNVFLRWRLVNRHDIAPKCIFNIVNLNMYLDKLAPESVSKNSLLYCLTWRPVNNLFNYNLPIWMSIWLLYILWFIIYIV
jgi:hypothetical protein